MQSEVIRAISAEDSPHLGRLVPLDLGKSLGLIRFRPLCPRLLRHRNERHCLSHEGIGNTQGKGSYLRTSFASIASACSCSASSRNLSASRNFFALRFFNRCA